eukprot:gnl/MRDRNA2_/MRDRNA2_111317_c0_seq1.p1 gnl/MRDRNA2_/MRDRNA2_111317_c0~~gnl/MRDRNA2_/MRDRNA2_111317_c0_seq1.p1  ORF type:complete len:491 (+),score=88.89 gnl/MRDRNA2_/MRDRNA2_111317_c0_seq1:69-1541(+)
MLLESAPSAGFALAESLLQDEVPRRSSCRRLFCTLQFLLGSLCLALVICLAPATNGMVQHNAIDMALQFMQQVRGPQVRQAVRFQPLPHAFHAHPFTQAVSPCDSMSWPFSQQARCRQSVDSLQKVHASDIASQLAADLLDVTTDDVETTSDDPVKVQTALVSVHDEAGLEDIAKYFVEHGVLVVSEGTTLAKMKSLGCNVQSAEEFLGSPNLLEGKSQKLNKSLKKSLEAASSGKQNVRPVELVIWNLYPFEECVVESDDFNACIENMDESGPAMIRSAAVNKAGVTVVTSPDQYKPLLGNMNQNDGCTSGKLRDSFADTAFELTENLHAALTGWSDWAESETGRVKNWNDQKQFGFIVSNSGGEDLFCHASCLVEGGQLMPGDRVMFLREYNSRNGKYRAVKVKKLAVQRKEPAKDFEGKIAYWNSEKGYGFIAAADGSGEIFCHVSALTDGDGSVRQGDQVKYNKVENNRRGKPSAANVRLGGAPAI